MQGYVENATVDNIITMKNQHDQVTTTLNRSQNSDLDLDVGGFAEGMRD